MTYDLSTSCRGTDIQGARKVHVEPGVCRLIRRAQWAVRFYTRLSDARRRTMPFGDPDRISWRSRSDLTAQAIGLVDSGLALLDRVFEMPLAFEVVGA